MSFVKIDRNIIDSQVWGHNGIFKLWIWLLLKANYKDGFSPVKTGVGYQSISLKRGQLLFGKYSASEELYINSSTLYKWLKKLEEWGNIKIESNHHNSLITIVKYNEYQDIVTTTEPQRIHNVSTTYPQRNTSEEVKEVKEVKEEKKELTPMEFIFEKWINYRIEIKKPLKPTSIKAAFEKLTTLAGGDLAIAEAIINQSISNGWQGIFHLQNIKEPHKTTERTGPTLNRI